MYRVEYIWIDGTKPLSLVRSKTRVLKKGKQPGNWNFDGSSTNQAVGANSDCILVPVFTCPDPIRGGDDILVLCEVREPNEELSPHPTNTRVLATTAAEKYGDRHDMWFGMEQEYTLMKDNWPFGFPHMAYPAPQGPYYCGVGATQIAGRDLVEEHTTYCMQAGLDISGTNAEVMPGQWEFQIGPAGTVDVGDQIWMARYLLYRTAEKHGVNASIKAKPMAGDWNGAGMHTNFSSKSMREEWAPIITAAEALGKPGKPELHIERYGHGKEERLTGEHETAHWSEYNYGVADRGASVRIPWQVALDQKGYLEDRRPMANADPYVVAALITNTVCEQLDKAGQVSQLD